MAEKRMRISALILAVLSIIVVTSASAQDETARNARGTFTGEIKPVLYVSDVETSGPFYRDVLGFEFFGYAKLKDEPYYAEMAAERAEQP